MSTSTSPEIFWFIPTGGDGRYLGSTQAARNTSFSYLAQIAQAADTLGFDGALLPTGAGCEDAWVLASALSSLTRNLRFLVAVRPGLYSPVLAARQAATLDRISGGRLLFNVVSGSSTVEQRAEGVPGEFEARYDLTRQWVDAFTRLLAGEKVSVNNEWFRLEDAQLLFTPLQVPHPPIYFGGSSEAALDVAAAQSEVYLSWGEPTAQLAEKLGEVRTRAARLGRTLRYGLRAHIIVRETEEEAWADADRLIAHLNDDTIAKAQTQLHTRGSQSVGQSRMTALHGGKRENLRIDRNLWAGVGLVRGGAGTALVGSAEGVARAIREYQEIGVDTFILSGYPHLEEAYRTAELLFPLLGKRSSLFPTTTSSAVLPNVGLSQGIPVPGH